MQYYVAFVVLYLLLELFCAVWPPPELQPGYCSPHLKEGEEEVEVVEVEEVLLLQGRLVVLEVPLLVLSQVLEGQAGLVVERAGLEEPRGQQEQLEGQLRSVSPGSFAPVPVSAVPI